MDNFDQKGVAAIVWKIFKLHNENDTIKRSGCREGSDEFPVGPARNSTQGCFAHDLHLGLRSD